MPTVPEPAAAPRDPSQREPGEKLQGRVKNATTAKLSPRQPRAKDMTTIHDDGHSSLVRELERSLRQTRSERDALASDKDELEAVLAAGRLGYCRVAHNRRVVEASTQFKAEFGWPPDAQISWPDLLDRLQRADRAKLTEAVDGAFDSGAEIEIGRAHV